MGHAFEAIDKDSVPREQAFVFVDTVAENVEKFPDRVEEAERRIERQAANAEIRGHHALAADHFVNPQQIFTLAEAIEKDRHRAQVQSMGTQPHQVRADALQFGKHYPHPLRPRRDLHSQQLLYRQNIAEIVHHGAEVIDAVGERNHLLVELGFAGFFDPGVEEADIGHESDNLFAIDLQHQPQHSVRRRMLRPHVENHGFLMLRIERGSNSDGIFDVGHYR